ncbi:hypothetical protein [Hallella absiana]|uniref:hypothetical protein n=1 Tax=Hallella absiana TaxID=2925336 RepID=UPI0021C5FBC0|nr:hypothetical protein [Hallella absiana]
MERFVRKATAEDLPVALVLIESGRRSWQRLDSTTVASSICSTVMSGWLIRR